MSKHLLLFAESSDLIAIAASQVIQLPAKSDDPLPSEIVWMPKGEHQLKAYTAGGKPVEVTVLCDEAGAQSIQTSFAEIIAAGRRVYLDKDHDDGEAVAWVMGFRWDPAQGIMAKVEWTSLGEQLLRGKVYYSFSPVFFTNKKTNRVSKLLFGHAAGSLVNAPAFGAAMPALIAARLAGAESPNPASGGSPDNPQQNQIMKSLLIKILAALAVEVPADATEDQLVALATKHIDKLPSAGAEGEALKAQLAELTALKTKDAERRKADAKAAVDAAVARGALPAKDDAIQAKWAAMIEADPKHAELLAALPDNPALKRVTAPGAGVVVKDNLVEILRAYHAKKSPDERAVIYARDISPMIAKPGLFLGPILAENSLGTLTGDLVVQRSLTLLKLSFPWLTKISTDFSSAGIKLNQSVITRLRAVPAMVPYVPGAGYARQPAVLTDVPVKITEHNGVEIAFNANELASTARDLFGEQAEGCHYALGKGLVDSVLALLTVANFSHESVEAVADVDADTMDALSAALTGRGVPGMARIGLLASSVYRKLGKDASIMMLAAFQRPEIITQEYALPPVKGIMPYEVINLPIDEDLIGFAGTPDALALATRVPNDYSAVMPDIAGNGVVQIVTNLDTGISVMLVRYVDHKAAEAAWRVALMWGAAKGNPLCGQRLVSRATSS
jgi:phage I-like protein